PDNGVAIPTANTLDDDFDVYKIEVENPQSNTFHGRDVFAPAAARLESQPFEALDDVDFLSQMTDYKDYTLPKPEINAESAKGEVITIDEFGNVITNIPGSILEGHFDQTIFINGEEVPVRKTYATRPSGERLVTVGSHDNVELAVNQGRGDEAFNVTVGTEVYLKW
ncbi:MAG: S-adenosyl-l-methionine hydroxide adenosyltransferase family protein, partial [Halobacteriaceae archaeon]